MNQQDERTCLWFRTVASSSSSTYRTECLRLEQVSREDGVSPLALPSITDTDWLYCPGCGGRIKAQDDRIMKSIAAPRAIAKPTTPMPVEAPTPFSGANPFAGLFDHLTAPEPVKPKEPHFTFGRHRGKTHEWVAQNDPNWLVWAYTNVTEHAGIDKQLYLACTDAVNKQLRRGYSPRHPQNRGADPYEFDGDDDDIPF